MPHWAQDLLHFWFHELGPSDWFGRNDTLDAELRRRYARWLNALSGARAQAFLGDPATARAAILLFDQIPRNIHRGSVGAFAMDALAQAICRGLLARGWYKPLGKHERQFALMPLMHSEHIRDQHESLARFTALGDGFITGFARDHYRMIARFGRFPHRNPALGRTSSTAELRAVEAGHAW